MTPESCSNLTGLAARTLGDVSNADQFVDISSNTPPHNLKDLHDAGFRGLVVKCTEADSYVWSDSHEICKEWRSFGDGVWLGHYHFAAPQSGGSGKQQADWFWNHVKGDVQPGDVLIGDFETKGETGTEHRAFHRQLAAHSHLEQWTYGGAYFLRDNHIKPNGTLLWIAGYPTFPFIPTGWTKRSLAAHQFTDAATVPGISGRVDMSKLLIPRSKPGPAPHPGKDERTPLSDEAHNAAVHLLSHLNHRQHRPDAPGDKLLDELGAQIHRVRAL